MNIYVLISTLDAGISRVPGVLCPEQSGVHYVVVWQQSPGHIAEDLPASLGCRRDLVVDKMPGRGLSRSRNRAMDVAASLMGDVLEDAVFVIADDDERIEPEALFFLQSYYSVHPQSDVMLLRVRDAEGRYHKDYPSAVTPFCHRPRGYYPSSVELTFRSRLWHLGLRFDERFGLGAPRLCAGEEDIFLFEAQRRGLTLWLVPHDLCVTSSHTTGSRQLDVKVLRSKGAVYGYEYPLWKALWRSWRESLALAVRHRVSASKVFKDIWYGVKYIRS